MADPVKEGDSTENNRAAPRERLALQLLALVAVLALLRLALPLGVGLLLGILLAFVLEPVFQRLERAGVRPTWAALGCAVGSTIITGGILFVLAYVIVSQGVALVGSIPAAFAPGGSFHDLADRGSALFRTLHIDTQEVLDKAKSAAMAVGEKAAGMAALVAGATFEGILALLILTLTTYYVILHWPELVRRAERDLPFRPDQTRALLAEFRDVGRHVLFGTVSAGIVQGLLAAFGYGITGVPRPALFGVVTAMASLIPAIGTVLVWGGLGVFQVLTGHLVSGIAELIYGALVVGVAVDYFIRPKLVGSRSDIPALLTFIGLLGGVAVFSVIGLLLGPVIVTMCVAVLRIYDREAAPNPQVGGPLVDPPG